MNASSQLSLAIEPPRHGGRRPGAGRRKTKRAGVPHAARPRLSRHTPVHVTLHVRPHVWNLRAKRTFFRIWAAFQAGCERFDVRIVQYSVQGNHVHLLVEARDAGALGQSMKGLSVRIARKLNALMGCRGAVFSDRFHARVLRSPLEVKRVLGYILNNARRHAAERGEAYSATWFDVFSSAPFFDGFREGRVAFPMPVVGRCPVAEARSWLVRTGWKKHGLLSVSDVPRSD